MSANLSVKEQCYHCHGTGKITVFSPEGNSEIACYICVGTGYIEVETIDVTFFVKALGSLSDNLNNLSDRVDDIYDKVEDIFEILKESKSSKK